MLIPSKGNCTQGRRRKDEICKILAEKGNKSTKLGKSKKSQFSQSMKKDLVVLVQITNFKKTLKTMIAFAMH